MRILNSPAAWGIAIAAVFIYCLMVATAADATRIVMGHNYPDLCKNRGVHAMPHKQTVATFGFWEFINPDQEPNRVGRRDCQPGPRLP